MGGISVYHTEALLPRSHPFESRNISSHQHYSELGIGKQEEDSWNI